MSDSPFSTNAAHTNPARAIADNRALIEHRLSITHQLGNRELRLAMSLVQLAGEQVVPNGLVHMTASAPTIAAKMDCSLNTFRESKRRLCQLGLLVEEAVPGSATRYLLDAPRVFARVSAEAKPRSNHFEPLPVSEPLPTFEPLPDLPEPLPKTGEPLTCTPSNSACTPSDFEGVVNPLGGPPIAKIVPFPAWKPLPPKIEGVQGTELAKHVLNTHVIKEHVLQEHVAPGKSPGESPAKSLPPGSAAVQRLDAVLVSDESLTQPRVLQAVFEIIAANHARDPKRWRAPSDQLRVWIFASARCVFRAKHLQRRVAVFAAGLKPGGTIHPTQSDEDWAVGAIRELDYGPKLPRSGPALGEPGLKPSATLLSEQREKLMAILARRQQGTLPQGPVQQGFRRPFIRPD